MAQAEEVRKQPHILSQFPSGIPSLWGSFASFKDLKAESNFLTSVVDMCLELYLAFFCLKAIRIP